jgi:hypothetical protein
MSPYQINHSQHLRKTTAALSILTFILTLTTLSTTAAVRIVHHPKPPIHPSIHRPKLTPTQTYNLTPQYPWDTYPLATSTLATT